MKLYFVPGACSLAANIALREAGVPFDLAKVDLTTRKVEDGSDFQAVNPKGYVPALRLDSGEILTENAALLQYIGDRNPAAKLLPASGTDRYRVLEWVSFINSELHKGFSPLFAPHSNDGAKTYSRGNLTNRLGWLNGALGSKKHLTGEPFTVADAYAFVVLNWTGHVGIDIDQWPNLKRFQGTVGARPHVLAALKAEGLIQ
jgi:glutathione S-transferase